MEEVLHQLGCTKLCKQWDNLPTSTGDLQVCEPSTVVHCLGSVSKKMLCLEAETLKSHCRYSAAADVAAGMPKEAALETMGG